MSQHTPRSAIFPYTTLFRSQAFDAEGRETFVGKDEIEEHPGRSPDWGDAVCRRTWFELQKASPQSGLRDRKSTRLNSSHVKSSYAGGCLKKKCRLLRPVP